ncbi:hypothetical protein [Alsobacter soli]|uniref:hypothetical protein n=1 Tax=Alsobacter soli TaxID=2109933 RepID=UPI0018AD5A92|nr:hypothetical protein [Alsobacter soli]
MGGVSIWHWIVVLLPIAIPLILKFGFNVGAKKLVLKNPRTGQMKIGFYGFSWTYFFFGFLVPLIRGELGVAALHLLFSVVTFGLWQLIVSFLYNKQYTQRLVSQGYVIQGSDTSVQVAASKLGIDLMVHQAAMS